VSSEFVALAELFLLGRMFSTPSRVAAESAENHNRPKSLTYILIATWETTLGKARTNLHRRL
jgi:hypothetical protein